MSVSSQLTCRLRKFTFPSTLHEIFRVIVKIGDCRQCMNYN